MSRGHGSRGKTSHGTLFGYVPPIPPFTNALWTGGEQDAMIKIATERDDGDSQAIRSTPGESS